MYKSTIFPFLIILDPFAFIEQHTKDKSSQITAQKFYEIEKKYMEIKNFWEEEDLASQKQYCSFNKNSFHNF